MTDEQWGILLNRKLVLLAEVQQKTFDMIEKYNHDNDKAHKEILEKMEELH